MSDQIPTNPPPPAPGYGGVPPQNPNQDAEHMRLLAIFHYVMGALIAVTGCAFLIFAGAGAIFGFAAPQDPNVSAEDAQVFKIIGAVYGGIGVIGTIMSILCGSLVALSGRKMNQRKGRTFSYVMAGILCTFMPLGTALGVFTFIVLGRDSVRAMYE